MDRNKTVIVIIACLVLLAIILAATKHIYRSKSSETGTTEFGGAYLEDDWPTRY